MGTVGTVGNASILFPDDIRALQGFIAGEVTDLGNAIATAPEGKVSPALEAVWEELRGRADAFVAEDVGILSNLTALEQTGDSLKGELSTWYLRLDKLGVTHPPPGTPPVPTYSTSNVSSGVSALLGNNPILLLGIVVGVAWVFGRDK